MKPFIQFFNESNNAVIVPQDWITMHGPTQGVLTIHRKDEHMLINPSWGDIVSRLKVGDQVRYRTKGGKLRTCRIVDQFTPDTFKIKTL